MADVLQTAKFTKWLTKLRDKKARGRILVRIKRLSDTGNMGDAKSVGGGVSEFRIDYGPGYRVYFTKRGEQVYLLLCGGDKSTQTKDIAQAHKMAKELDE